MIDELKEAGVWAKNNKGKVVTALGSAFFINNLFYPIINVSLIFGGLIMEIHKHYKNKHYGK